MCLEPVNVLYFGACECPPKQGLLQSKRGAPFGFQFVFVHLFFKEVLGLEVRRVLFAEQAHTNQRISFKATENENNFPTFC